MLKINIHLLGILATVLFCGAPAVSDETAPRPNVVLVLRDAAPPIIGAGSPPLCWLSTKL